jgi:hypothetical protein
MRFVDCKANLFVGIIRYTRVGKSIFLPGDNYVRNIDFRNGCSNVCPSCRQSRRCCVGIRQEPPRTLKNQIECALEWMHSIHNATNR